jgi:hypothetical protein
MNLPLLKTAARWGYSLEFPSMPPSQGREHGYLLVLCYRFDMLEPKLRESRPEPGDGSEEAFGALGFDAPDRNHLPLPD